MGEKLVNSPLVEALCEFKFLPEEEWDWTIPGRLYSEIKNEFSESGDTGAVSMKINEGPPQIIKGPDRVQLKRPDGTAIVQIGASSLIINFIPPYAGWEIFREKTFEIFGKYIKLFGMPTLEQVGLRYINRIAVPKQDENFSIGNLITLDPPLKGVLDKSLVGFNQRYEILQDSPTGILVHQTSLKVVNTEPSIFIDLDFVSREKQNLSDVSSIETWLNQAHTQIYDAFKASLPPEVYERFRKGE